MTIHNMSHKAIIVKLPTEPEIAEELELASKIVTEKPGFDMVMDCSKMGLVTCSALCGFMKLHKILTDRGRHLFFCNVGAITRGVLSIYGFDRIFQVLDETMESLESSKDSKDAGTVVFTGTDGSRRPLRRNSIRLDVCAETTIDVTLWSKLSVDGNRQWPDS